VILRLGRKLIENGADVYFIVQDSTDGIRDYKFLNNSTNEKHFGNLPIPNDQLERLSNRVKIVNSLYETNFSDNLKQFAIEIHIDSRSERKNIDIFFYHKEGDTLGLNLAETIRKTIDKKYSKTQPGRGYEGTLSSRNLYMVRNLKPTTIFIEIGNIQNPKDQKRIIEPNNRQAIANWITDGILNYIIEN
jgi:N-acetylmuramoyl-L-alanine amidase